ncbi:ArsR/SmtB family transcription factor [Halorarius halobius]|uniref:ArsR/SmtB family transcription factor n=1 Tax=Halorarius halobius TaxID=2962671 RepID=UPI0020CCEF60|nr:helix-turn-helix transcriptional regulator [Halorarius halobius]
MNRDDTLGAALDALSAAQRRRVLLKLADGEPIPVDDLTAGADDRRQATVELHHRHLPRLDDAGYVAWDRTAGQLRRGENWNDVAPLLAALPVAETDGGE